MVHLFQSYPKIPESFDAFQLSEADYRLLKKTDWVVTEKIHGANFCVLSNEATTSFAKRKEILTDEENFFGYHALRDDLMAKVKTLFTQMLEGHPDTRAVAVYGELFGGAYPHPEVPSIKGVQAIQTGIYYCPEVRFWVFDIVNITDTSSYFVDFTTMTEVCEAVNLPYVPALLKGSFNEAQNYSIEFESTIPALLNLPPLSLKQKNLAEGIVIKPAQSLLMDTSKGWIRPVIKKKIKLFSEDSRYQQAQKWSGDTGASQQLGEVLMVVQNLVNQNRLNNVISKIGALNTQNTQQLSLIKSTLEADVWESFWEKHSPQYFQLSPKEQTQVNTEVTLAVERLISSI